MLYALPEGFPTPDAQDGKGLAKALGDAAARWMRGEYPAALARLHAAIVIAATERASNARIDRLEKVVGQLETWLAARERGEDVPPPSLNESFVISVQVPDRPITERRSDHGPAPSTMSLASRDLEELERLTPTSPQGVSPPVSAQRPIGGRIERPASQGAFSKTLEEAARPAVHLAAVATSGNAGMPATLKSQLGTTLPEGAALPPALRASLESKRSGVVRSDPFTGLDAAATPSEAERKSANPANPASDATSTTSASASASNASASKTEPNDERPRSKISTQRFVPPTTRRPAEGEVYPPILPSEEDE